MKYDGEVCRAEFMAYADRWELIGLVRPSGDDLSDQERLDLALELAGPQIEAMIDAAVKKAVANEPGARALRGET